MTREGGDTTTRSLYANNFISCFPGVERLVPTMLFLVFYPQVQELKGKCGRLDLEWPVCAKGGRGNPVLEVGREMKHGGFIKDQAPPDYTAV